MQILIVDDDPMARLRLLRLCEQRADLQVIGQAESGAAAIEAVRTAQPTLVLLDVQLQDMTGFDVLRALDRPAKPATIMVTSHADYALQAFEFAAIDYLTKPVEADRFGQAIERARHRLRPMAPLLDDLAAELRAKVLDSAAHVRQTLVGESARRMFVLEAANVDYIEADGNYVHMYIGADRYISRTTIQHMTSRLEPLGFVRIERSLLVNFRRVAYVERLGHGEFTFTMRAGARLVSSRSHRRAIIQELRGAS